MIYNHSGYLSLKMFIKTYNEIRMPNLVFFKKSFEKGVQSLVKDAIKEFIKAIIIEDAIKVDTGMSRASLLPLASQVRMLAEVRSSINPKTGGRSKKYKPPSGWPTYSKYKNITQGKQIGKQAYKLEFNGPNVKFIFSIKVYQYYIGELGLSGKPPWDSLKIGEEAFLEYINKNKDKYVPKFTSWLVKVKVK